MRLIDADAMREEWLENGENEYVYDTNAFLDSIDAPPTIETVEVVHSEWEICERENTVDTYGNPVTYARCKHCGFSWSNKYHTKNYFKHCPNCGADMRKGGAE